MNKYVIARKNDTDFVGRYNSLFFTLKIERKFALLQTTMFLVRRLLLITAIFFFKSSPYLQFLSMYGLTLPFIFLLIIHPPLMTPLMNRVELYNESIILSCTCLLIGFTDYSTEAAARDTLGWLFIGVASTIIAVTVAVIVYEVSTSLYGKWRTFRESQVAKKYDIRVVDAKDDCKLEDIEEPSKPRKKHAFMLRNEDSFIFNGED
jgi:hypothetical protein